MKKYLLFVMGFFMVSINAMAYSTSGDFNSFGVKCTEDNTNHVQTIELQQAGAFANFVADGNFNANFDGSTFTKVVFVGPMNADDIAAIKVESYEAPFLYDYGWGTAWFNGNFQNCTVLDFSGVTTSVAPLLKYNNNYGNGPHSLVIWPAATNPTTEQLVQMYNLGGTTDFAYYTDNNPNIIKFPGKNVINDKFDVLIDELATLVSAGYHTFQAIEFVYSQKSLTEVDYNTNIHGDGQGNAAPAFLTKLAQFPVASINFQGLNLSSLGKNFSNLNNPATHYIVLPVNNASGYAAGTDFATYTYPSNIYVAAAYAGAAPYGGGGDMGGQNYNIVADPYASSITMTYVKETGKLQGGAPYLPSVMKNADKLVLYGNINNDDLNALGLATSPYVDLSDVVLVEGASLANYQNANVQYLALPDNGAVSDFVPSALKTKCPKLLGVGLYKEATTTYLAENEIDNKLYYASWLAGGVRTIMYMLPEAQNTGYHEGSARVGLRSYKMWGPLNAADISNKSAYLTADGHVGVEYVLNDEGKFVPQAIAGAVSDGPNYGLLGGSSTQIYDADLSMAWFPNEDDMNFNAAAAYNGTTFAACELPRTHMTTITAHAFDNMQGLHYIGIPNIYTTIKGYAFYLTGNATVGDGSGVGPFQIDTYQVQKGEGVNPYSCTADDALIVETISNGPLTVTLPESLGNNTGEGLYTGSMQYSTRVKDVYVMADPAPICQIDAFGSVAYVGNNTYGGVQSHPFARDKYRMGVGTYTEEKENQWICVLHFPASTVKNGENYNYTDPTREYCLYDETGAVDGNGMPVVWPNQSEMLRSYNQAITGVTWNAWDRTRVENPGYNNYNEFATAEGYGVYNTSTPQYNKPGTDQDEALTYNKTKYCGWHQFILANTWLPEIVTYEDEEINYVKLDWFTFCIPYNMTKKQVIELLGVPKSDEHVTRKLNGVKQTADVLPDVRTLVAVTRYPFKSIREIKLHLSKNIVEQPNDLHVELRYDQTKYDLARPQANSDVLGDDNEWVPLTGDENQVYIKGGYPYLIRAYVPEEFADKVSNLGGLTLMRGTFGSQNAGFKHTCTDGYASVAPYEQKVQAYVNEEGKDGVENPAVYPALFDDTKDETKTTDQAVPEGMERYIYTFVGQYWPQYLPLYSYYLGTNSKAAANAETKKKFYRATAKLEGSDVFSKWTWNPYVSIITANADKADVHEPHKNPSTGAYTSSLSMDFNGYDDTFDKGKAYNGTGDVNGAKYVFVFDDGIDEDLNGETTSIGYFNGTPVLPANGKIYNMNGQFVGTSAGSLQKGLYVVNGKKFIIK